MGIFTTLLLLAGAAAILWFAVHIIRNNPQSFSQANLGKSLYTVGLLALMILVLIALCVLLLRS